MKKAALLEFRNHVPHMTPPPDALMGVVTSVEQPEKSSLFFLPPRGKSSPDAFGRIQTSDNVGLS